jgi:hypothetical protein
LARPILCGGSAGSADAEAAVMGRYAQRSCGYQGQIVLEHESRSTWENIQNAVPLIQDVDRIKIVSHPMHAYKARAYLHRQRPDLAARLVRGDDYRLGEWLVAKPLLAAYGRWTTRHLSTAPPVPVAERPRDRKRKPTRVGGPAENQTARGVGRGYHRSWPRELSSRF